MNTNAPKLLCLSDFHGNIHGNFHKFPVSAMLDADADAVLIAGDVTNDGTAGRTLRHFQEVSDAEEKKTEASAEKICTLRRNAFLAEKSAAELVARDLRFEPSRGARRQQVGQTACPACHTRDWYFS